MKKEIVVIGAFGNSTKTIKITQPSGAGGIYHISTDNWHEGEIIKTERYDWQMRFNTRSYLTGNDLDILADMIEKNKK